MVEEYNESLSSFEGEERSVKKLKEVKPYVERLKRHKDAILSLWAVGGPKGSMIVSGSADEKVRIWDMQKRTISPSISFERPVDSIIIRYQ